MEVLYLYTAGMCWPTGCGGLISRTSSACQHTNRPHDELAESTLKLPSVVLVSLVCYQQNFLHCFRKVKWFDLWVNEMAPHYESLWKHCDLPSQDWGETLQIPWIIVHTIYAVSVFFMYCVKDALIMGREGRVRVSKTEDGPCLKNRETLQTHILSKSVSVCLSLN